MAGIGRGCPHQHQGQTSCINGGRIDASCCVDSHISVNRGCQQQPWIDGVMCCQQSGMINFLFKRYFRDLFNLPKGLKNGWSDIFFTRNYDLLTAVVI